MADFETPSDDAARADLALLLQLRSTLSKRARSLQPDPNTSTERRDAMLARRHRCDRVLHLLDTRIRLAAELLTQGRVEPVRIEPQARAS